MRAAAIKTCLTTVCVTGALLCHPLPLHAGENTDQVEVRGDVPDNETRANILRQLRDVYGADRVRNRLDTGNVSSPANWGNHVTHMISSDLQKVSDGKIRIDGNSISISGNVPSRNARQTVLRGLAKSFDEHYVINDNLHIKKPKPDHEDKQQALDDTLGERTIEFKSGSAILTSKGKKILDEMAKTIDGLDEPFIQIIGHTDNVGNRRSNIRLSLGRARSVKQYLVKHGISRADLSISGQGPDNPIADNDTREGRARNRRIEFRVSTQ